MSPARRAALWWATLVVLPSLVALTDAAPALAAKKTSRGATSGASARPSASAPRIAHSAVLAQLKRGLDLEEQGNKDLDAARDDAAKANVSLRAAHAQIAKGRRLVSDGEAQQKLGRDLERRGRVADGEAKIAAGVKTIDDGAREIAAGVASVKAVQATLNAIHARIVRARGMIEEGRRLSKQAQTQL